ncbi:MAG: AAA family ATPase, partial [bacterium]
MIFSDGINLITGPNGWGKSNMLEAVFIISVGRDPWGAEHDEIVKYGSDAALLKSYWEKRNKVEIRILRGGVKNIILNEKRIRRLSELVGLFPVTIAGPQEVEIVRGTPKYRRRLLDLHISQLSREYLENITRYQAYLKGRNKILKQLQDG